jgi:hypothetical protein
MRKTALQEKLQIDATKPPAMLSYMTNETLFRESDLSSRLSPTPVAQGKRGKQRLLVHVA